MGGTVMHSQRQHDREPCGAISTGRRAAAVVVDLLVALAIGLMATAVAIAAVLTIAMRSAGASLPASPIEAVLYLAFPIIEVLAFTPVGLVAPGVIGGLGMLLVLSRYGVLPVRSPGMILLSIDHQGTPR
jgi:hypothetical protein